MSHHIADIYQAEREKEPEGRIGAPIADVDLPVAAWRPFGVAAGEKRIRGLSGVT